MMVPSRSRVSRIFFEFGKRLFQIVLLLIVVGSLVFGAFDALQADPIRSMSGVNASEEAVEALRREFGYDRPRFVRYVEFVLNLLRFEFGNSLVTRRPVSPDLLHSYAATLAYVGSALAMSALMSLVLVYIGYVAPIVVKRSLLNISAAVTSFPSLVVATTIGVVLVRSGIFLGGDSQFSGFLMAAFSLAVYPTFSLLEIALRASEQAAISPASMALRSFGFSESSLFRLGILRPTLLPWIGHLSNVAAALVTGSVIIEAVFSLPGLGRLLIQSVLRGDLPMMQGVVVASVVGFVILDWITRAISDCLIGDVFR